MKPDEGLFKVHLDEAPFLAGADVGKWNLHGEIKDIVWPNPVMWVAADKDIVPVGRVYLKFTVDGYPASAPTACPWNVEKNSRLDHAAYPKVPGKFARVFRADWNGGVALYAPCDRLAMPGHETWKQQFPYWWWEPHFTIVKYLAFVHQCLNPIRCDNEPA